MTDSNHAPNHPSTGPPDYEGTDPDLPDRKNEGSRLGVSTIQVGASAGAAVTSALAASFFGVAGTLIGAAVGSIVSTIAGALYSHYLGRAGERIKVTKDVVIHRIPGEVRTTSPLRHLTGPSDLPGRESLQPIGDERHDETVALPVEDASELLQQPDGMAPLDETQVMPAYGSAAAAARYRSVQVPGSSGSARAASNGAGSHQPAANGPGSHGAGPHGAGPRGSGPQGVGPSRSAAAAAKPWWKKPAVAMSAVSAAGFLIALVVVLTTELVIGHPVSGGDSGTTFTKIGSSSTTKTKVTPTESATDAPSATATDTPSNEATTDAPDPTATTDPTATSDAGPNATDQPSAEPTDQGAVATEAAQGLGATAAP